MDKDKYREQLLKPNNTYDDVAKYLEPFLPGQIYKYGNFDSKYWENLIFKGEIYLSQASSFNDPFDCLLYCDVDKVCKSPKFIKIMIAQYPSIKKSDIINNVEEIKQFLSEKFQDDMRVTCFSEVWKSILMWSHYADCHKGFCIEYDTVGLSKTKRRLLFPVLYQEEQIDITENIQNFTSSAGLITMVSKALEWEYEREWRMISIRKDRQERFYFRKEIRSVILGLRCSKENREKVCKWALENGKEVYQTFIIHGKYELDRERII